LPVKWATRQHARSRPPGPPQSHPHRARIAILMVQDSDPGFSTASGSETDLDQAGNREANTYQKGPHWSYLPLFPKAETIFITKRKKPSSTIAKSSLRFPVEGYVDISTTMRVPETALGDRAQGGERSQGRRGPQVQPKRH
jgi:hypothetical protein